MAGSDFISIMLHVYIIHCLQGVVEQEWQGVTFMMLDQFDAHAMKYSQAIQVTYYTSIEDSPHIVYQITIFKLYGTVI